MRRSLPKIATRIEDGSWIRVWYRSARSEEVQSRRGRVMEVVVHRDGSRRINFQRPDGQRMTLYGDGELVSHGSHYPTTGHAYKVQVAQPAQSETQLSPCSADTYGSGTV